MGVRDTLNEEMAQIYDELTMFVDTQIALDKVILSDENRDKVGQFLEEYENRQKLIKHGLKPMNRILMFGDSGTGKTFLTKALSNRLDAPMIYIDVAKSLSEDNIAKNISDIFVLAKYIRKCVVFLDECDSVAWNRDAVKNVESGVVRRATNSLFQQLDQMTDDTVFVAATNMLHRLDPAFERRFNLKMEFRKPDADLTETVKQFILPQFYVKEDLPKDLRDLVRGGGRLSYYEIEDVANRAMKRAVLNDTDDVSLAYIYKEFAKSMRLKIRFHILESDEESFKSPSAGSVQ